MGRRRAATVPPSPLADALAQVGDRWTLLVVAALLDGPKRFNELGEALEGIAPNVLSARLKQLTEQALAVSVPYSERPPRFVYELTDGGRELAGALRLLADWGARAAGEDRPRRHDACGTALEARWWCPTCETVVEDDDDGTDDLVFCLAVEQVAEAAARAAAGRGPAVPPTAARAPSPGRRRPSGSVSPEPRPIRFFILKSVRIDVVTPEDQVIAAWASAKVGAAATLISTGGPSERIATQPVPCSDVLYSPPPIAAEAPSTRLMSQSMPLSNASRLRPLTVIESFSR